MREFLRKLFRREPRVLSQQEMDELRAQQQLLGEQNRARQALGDEIRIRTQLNDIGL